MNRLLVVDDEEEVLVTLERRLTREGYQVDVAATEEEAKRLIWEAEPAYDVVITDMLMEGPTTGLEILRETLARDVFSEVIVLTAYANVVNAVECMRRGAFDYVEKNMPGVDTFELLSLKVAQAVDRRQSSVATVRRLNRLARLAEAEGSQRGSTRVP